MSTATNADRLRRKAAFLEELHAALERLHSRALDLLGTEYDPREAAILAQLTDARRDLAAYLPYAKDAGAVRLAASEAAAIEREQQACEDLEKEIAERREHLRQLVAPVIEYEGYPHTGGVLPLQGRTATAVEDLRVARDQLAARRRTLARLREAGAA